MPGPATQDPADSPTTYAGHGVLQLPFLALQLGCFPVQFFLLPEQACLGCGGHGLGGMEVGQPDTETEGQHQSSVRAESQKGLAPCRQSQSQPWVGLGARDHHREAKVTRLLLPQHHLYPLSH